MIQHPIFEDTKAGKITHIRDFTGHYDPNEWKELTVYIGSGLSIHHIRHQTDRFDAEIGDTVDIKWIVPKGEGTPWYYTSKKL
jgi:hypothetical protein